MAEDDVISRHYLRDLTVNRQCLQITVWEIANQPSLNFILAVERSPLEGGIQSDSGIHNLQAQIADAVAEQYAAEDVVFDATPTAGHGVGFAVTSEGVKNALDAVAATIPEELDDLQDVELTSPTAGQILEYDDNDGKWKNVANPASTTNFGAPYDENTTYNVPSLVIENNLLFKLNEGEVDVTGPFDPTKWTQTSLAELTAEDFPLSSTDPTPTSEAIGDLSQLTTSDKSSLVGAVNEVNSNTKPVYLSTITTGANISFSANTSYRVGNLVVLNCILKVTGNLANNATVLSGIPKNGANAPIRFLRVVGSDIYYGHDDNAGGFNIDANATSVSMFGALTASSSSPKYLFVNITYICSLA